MKLFGRLFGRKVACACCHKEVRPYTAHCGGPWSGAADQLMAMPKLEADNAFACEQCGAVICPVCSGNKASELGVRMFVCTQCGHKPIKTIYRK